MKAACCAVAEASAEQGRQTGIATQQGPVGDIYACIKIIMRRTIKKVAVLGSGVMGSRIACHFAGIGVQVLLLDIVPKDIAPDAKPAERNKIVNEAMQAAIKSNPSPLYTKDAVKRIS